MDFKGRDLESLNELSSRVIAAAIEVHRHLGAGLLESSYERAMAVELAERKIPFVSQPVVPFTYKGHDIGDGRLDLLVDSCLIVELKAVEKLADAHMAQVLSYLKTASFPLGLLINFNVARLTDGIKRIILSSSL